MNISKFSEMLGTIEALFPEEGENVEIQKRSEFPGATFLSAYGPAIYSGARRCLSGNAQIYKLSSREKEANWPYIFMSLVLKRAKEPLAQKLPGAPDIAKFEAEWEKARLFKQAYEAISGVKLSGGGKIPAHQRLAMAQEVPPMLRVQAKELHDHGACQYSDSAVKLGEKFARADRGREMLLCGKILGKRTPHGSELGRNLVV